MENKDKIYYQRLVQRYAENKASEEELEVFFHLLHQGKLDEWINQSMNEDADIDDKPTLIIKLGRYIKYNWGKLSAAAVIFTAVTCGFVFFQKSSPKSEALVVMHETVEDVSPGINKAILTLADGQKVILDSASLGRLAIQASTEIINNGGNLVYKDAFSPENSPASQVYNTLSTGRAETYSLTLSDGSKVWLNSSSSIRFPVVFSEKKRTVEVRGEVYFEVTTKMNGTEKVPFIVDIKANDGFLKGSIEVLGTHFNINAYDEESSVNTTLLEGSVRVVVPDVKEQVSSVLLQPGQQSRSVNGEGILVFDNVNIDEAVAWKNGLFIMNNAEIASVLRQLSRWYDVDIVYKNGLPKGNINGDIPRNTSLSKVLKVLELSGVTFKIEGKKIIVET